MFHEYHFGPNMAFIIIPWIHNQDPGLSIEDRLQFVRKLFVDCQSNPKFKLSNQNDMDSIINSYKKLDYHRQNWLTGMVVIITCESAIFMIPNIDLTELNVYYHCFDDIKGENK